MFLYKPLKHKILLHKPLLFIQCTMIKQSALIDAFSFLVIKHKSVIVYDVIHDDIHNIVHNMSFKLNCHLN